MFEKRGLDKTEQIVSPVATDVVVHVMPQEFYGKEIYVPAQVPLPKAVVTVPPPPPPKPIVQPEPVKPPVVASPVSKHKSRLPLIVALFALLLLALGAGLIGYIFFVLPGMQATTSVATTTNNGSTQGSTPTPMTTTVPSVTTPAEPQPGKDTDSDGLTDVEELMYSTDYRDPDSDKDTYLDGNEVFHGYDPSSPAPSTLIDTGVVRILQNTQIAFTVFYATSWTPVISATDAKVTIRPSTTESFVVSSQAKDTALSLSDWFAANNKDSVAASELKATYTRTGIYELTRTDGRLAYLDGGDKVYTFTYDLGQETLIQYLQTFEMMVNSFTLIP